MKQHQFNFSAAEPKQKQTQIGRWTPPPFTFGRRRLTELLTQHESGLLCTDKPYFRPAQPFDPKTKVSNDGFVHGWVFTVWNRQASLRIVCDYEWPTQAWVFDQALPFFREHGLLEVSA